MLESNNKTRVLQEDKNTKDDGDLQWLKVDSQCCKHKEGSK